MKVAIVCGAPTSEMLAPFDNEEWEIWVLGNRLDHYDGKRVTRVFEIHDNLTEHRDPGLYITWLMDKKLPLVVGEKFFAEIGAVNSLVEEFPYKAVAEMYGSLYLTSSPAYMLGYALLNGAKEIGLYGVDLSIGDHEYFWQRPCVEAWIGFAKGRGVKVFIPDVSHVGKSKYVEGRDWNGEDEVGLFSEEGFNAMAAQHKESANNIQKERQALALKAAAQDGAHQAYLHLARVARAAEAQVEVKSLLETTILR